MVVIRLLELNENEAIYAYLPEGKEPGGKVSFDRRKKTRSILQKAKEDSNMYAYHALKRIEEYQSLGDFKKEDMIAWY